MGKVQADFKRLRYPLPVTLVGAIVKGKPNFLTIGFFAILSHLPPIISVSLYKNHYSVRGIKENGAFSVNIPSADMVKKTDYCGIVSGRKVDKSNLFKSFYGQLNTAPMIEECPLNFECKLFRTIEIGNNLIFLGEVVSVYANEEVLSGGVPDIRAIDPLVLFGSVYHSWKFGSEIAGAYRIGKKLKENVSHKERDTPKE
ncbi:MAG: flavin reductase family protein [Deltaproteobacteria bacterium]|nr:flavin reductase family protein [Deltaproteobacteria bacterium]MBW2562638.1 flavin reductase family protein [Deltaproteobacteria bacterium]